MDTVPDDPIASILSLSRERRNAEAIQRARALLASHPAGEGEVAESCLALVEWRAAALEGRPGGDGLHRAVEAIERLRRAGYGPLVGWAGVNAGLALALVGDIEEGLEWIDREIAQATERNDKRTLSIARTSKGNLLCRAGMTDEGYETFLEALDLCGEDGAVPREMVLNNLSYCRILKARSLGVSDPARPGLASEALRYAVEAMTVSSGSRDLAKWHCSFHSNRGIALNLLGRTAEAEEAFREGLGLAESNARTRVELQVEYADLLIKDGRLEAAGELLEQAARQVLDDPASPERDHVLDLQCELAHRQGRHEEARALWERRLRLAQDRHQERLRQVRRYTALGATLRQVQRAEEEARAQAEALRRTQQQLESTLKAIPDLMFRLDREGRILEAHAPNPAHLLVPPSQFLGKRFADVLPEEASRILADALDRAIKTGASHGTVYSLPLANGVAWFEVSMAAMPGAAGERDQFVQIVRDITERMQLEAEVRRMHEEARAELERQVRERTVALGEALLASQGAERVKEALLRNATHELRTPLNQIMGGADLLARTSLDPKQEKWRKMIHDASRDMLRQVNELLDAARLEGGEVKLESREFSPAAVLEQVRVALAPRAEKKGLALQLEADASLPERVVGDPTRLAQALLNYVDNAIKFTEQGSVTVSARAIAQGGGDAQLHFEVLDTGIGVAKEDQDRLFTAFLQLDATTTRKHAGLGIGLANVAEIARLMGGKVGVNSAPGKGSAFWLMAPFRLP